MRPSAAVKTSLLVARVLEGFREPSSMISDLLAPAERPAALRPVAIRADRPRRAPRR